MKQNKFSIALRIILSNNNKNKIAKKIICTSILIQVRKWRWKCLVIANIFFLFYFVLLLALFRSFFFTLHFLVKFTCKIYHLERHCWFLCIAENIDKIDDNSGRQTFPYSEKLCKSALITSLLHPYKPRALRQKLP